MTVTAADSSHRISGRRQLERGTVSLGGLPV